MQGVDPLAYMQGVDPLAYMQGVDPLAYMQGVDPLAYMQGVDPLAYMQGVDSFYNNIYPEESKKIKNENLKNGLGTSDGEWFYNVVCIKYL